MNHCLCTNCNHPCAHLCKTKKPKGRKTDMAHMCHFSQKPHNKLCCGGEELLYHLANNDPFSMLNGRESLSSGTGSGLRKRTRRSRPRRCPSSGQKRASEGPPRSSSRQRREKENLGSSSHQLAQHFTSNYSYSSANGSSNLAVNNNYYSQKNRYHSSSRESKHCTRNDCHDRRQDTHSPILDSRRASPSPISRSCPNYSSKSKKLSSCPANKHRYGSMSSLLSATSPGEAYIARGALTDESDLDNRSERAANDVDLNDYNEYEDYDDEDNVCNPMLGVGKRSGQRKSRNRSGLRSLVSCLVPGMSSSISSAHPKKKKSSKSKSSSFRCEDYRRRLHREVASSSAGRMALNCGSKHRRLNRSNRDSSTTPDLTSSTTHCIHCINAQYHRQRPSHHHDNSYSTRRASNRASSVPSSPSHHPLSILTHSDESQHFLGVKVSDDESVPPNNGQRTHRGEVSTSAPSTAHNSPKFNLSKLTTSTHIDSPCNTSRSEDPLRGNSLISISPIAMAPLLHDDTSESSNQIALSAKNTSSPATGNAYSHSYATLRQNHNRKANCDGKKQNANKVSC